MSEIMPSKISVSSVNKIRSAGVFFGDVVFDFT